MSTPQPRPRPRFVPTDEQAAKAAAILRPHWPAIVAEAQRRHDEEAQLAVPAERSA